MIHFVVELQPFLILRPHSVYITNKEPVFLTPKQKIYRSMTILTNDSVRFWDTTFVCIKVKYDTKLKN